MAQRDNDEQNGQDTYFYGAYFLTDGSDENIHNDYAKQNIIHTKVTKIKKGSYLKGSK